MLHQQVWISAGEDVLFLFFGCLASGIMQVRYEEVVC